MAKPRRKPGSVSGSRRQTTRTHFCWLVRTHERSGKEKKNGEKKEEEAEKAREAEISNLRKYAEAKKKIEAQSREIRAAVIGTLCGGTVKVVELPADRKWDVLCF